MLVSSLVSFESKNDLNEQVDVSDWIWVKAKVSGAQVWILKAQLDTESVRLRLVAQCV